MALCSATLIVVDGLWKVDSPRIAVSAVKSIIHPGAPEEPGFIRGDLLMSGYVIKEVEGTSHCMVSYLVQADVKVLYCVWGVVY